MSSCWVYSYNQGGKTLWGIASNGTTETRTGYFTKDAAEFGMKTWGFCDAILDRPPDLRFISPMGTGTTHTATTCVDMIALVYGGKKYWLNPSEFAGFSNPKWEEVSLSEFQAIPDGTSSITVNGVTISPKDTSVYCGTSKGVGDILSGLSGINPLYLIIVFILLLLSGRKR